jgi:quercetin dioxygenase-like cupin family protein
MGDTSVKKVDSHHSPTGQMGQKYLAEGIRVAMRLWENEEPAEAKPVSVRDYETVGYVIKGRAELHLEGQVLVLNPGDSWLVPKGASHTYKILETFTAVEATSPPASVHGRDEKNKGPVNA